MATLLPPSMVCVASLHQNPLHRCGVALESASSFTPSLHHYQHPDGNEHILKMSLYLRFLI